jgi:hypothetical protein
MLYLNPPYFVINGVSIFPDHQDTLQFYYLPMMPHLTTDSVGGNAMPRIQLIEYEGSAGTGGFINFDVNLGIDPDVLSDVANQLQRQARLSDQPRLSPVTFVDGTVKLVILGAESPAPAPSSGSAGRPASAPAPSSGADSGPKFVVKIQNAAKPALYGDNQATFSVQLDQYGATILEQAIKGQMAPIAVIYSLDFLGLRPAFNVHLSADWNRVQKYLDEHHSGGFLFFSSDIEKSVDSLIENQVISIQVDTFVPDGDTSASVGSDRDRAVSECYELIKNTFFESSLQPPNPNQPDGWDKAAGAFKNISDMALTGGAAGMASFSKKQVDLTRIDNKCLDVNISERSSVQRTIYPQAHLSGLLGVIQRNGVSVDQFIVKVDLDSPWFQRRHLNVVSHADFDTDSIASIDVNLTYNNIVKSVTLSSSGAQSAVEWSSVVVNGQMQRTVTYTYTVNFKNVDTTQRPGQLTSAPLSLVGDVLDIEPRNDLYGITVVPIRTFGLPWDRYPSAEVECRYVDQVNGINLQASAVLSSQTPEVDWPLFLRDRTHRSFDYRLSYTLASGGTSVTAWVATDAAKIDIVDPFPSKMSLIVVPALDWTVVDQALVFVAYPSKGNPIVQKEYILTKNNSTSQTFVAERQDASQNLIYYEARLIKHNGQLWAVPGSVTSDKYLIIQDGMKGRQIISVHPEPVDFTSKRVNKIDVQLRYADTQNSLNAATKFTLSTVTDVQSFSYDYINDQISPEYRVDIELDNGQTKSSDWAPTSGNVLTILLSQLD